MTTNAFESALNLAKRGYHVLPLHKAINGKCSCGKKECSSPGKHPMLKNGVKGATCDTKQVIAWGRAFKDSNWGVATGQVSGIVVVDVDDRNAATEFSKTIVPTFTVMTGKGAHFYFCYPDKNVPNRVRVMEHVDIRSDGGYVVAPGSVHYNGSIYNVICDTNPGLFPISILNSYCGNPDGIPTSVSNKFTHGDRNDSLYRMGRAMKNKGAGDESIRAALSAQNDSVCKPPLSKDELEKIVKQVVTQANRSDFIQNVSESPQDAPGSTFDVKLASDFVKEQIPPISWLLDTIVPAEAMTILAAYQKSGKTTWLYPLLSAIARGDRFMGLDTIQANVLVLAVEEPRSIIKDRLLSCGFDPDNPNDKTPLYLVQGGIVSSNNIIAKLDKEIGEKSIKLVAIDTLGTFLSLVSENDNAEVIRAMQPLKELRDKHGCSFILVHHTKKNHVGDHRRSHRGASAFGGFVDQIITMSQATKKGKGEAEDSDQVIDERSTQRLLQIIGRSDESPEKLLIDFDVETKQYSIVGNSLATIKDVKTYRVWLALNGKPRKIEEIVERTKISDYSVRRYLRDLCKLNQAKEITLDSEGNAGRPPCAYVRGPEMRKK